MARDLRALAAALLAVAAIVVAYVSWLHVTNATTVALTFLLVVLVVAATSRLWAALTTSVAALLAFNFFFLPPVGTLTIADPQNWMALFTFLAVSLVGSRLSTVARARTDEALARRDEMARLFDLSRDVLLMTDSDEAISQLARFIARRFDLDYVAICLPQAGDWRIAEAGSLALTLDKSRLSRAMAGGVTSGDDRVDIEQVSIEADHRPVRLVPLHLGTRTIGLLAAGGRPVDSGTLDVLGGLTAIAIERTQFLDERKAAEISRRSEELKSALLASLAHDLRTPLTTIRVAAGNLQATWLTSEERREQSALVLGEVGRLTRVFENILEMARIEAGAIGAELRWVHPSEIVEAACDQAVHALGHHPLTVQVDSARLVRVDPRLTAAALAHLLENAAQYAPQASVILAKAVVGDEGLVLTVRDHGPGIAPQDLPHVFDRFYRGTAAKPRGFGTGMGLSITRGLIAAEHGRVWAENCPDGGAQFTIVVPAEAKLAAEAEQVV